MADSLLVFVPHDDHVRHEQAHQRCSVLKEVGNLSPDGTRARAVKFVMKFIRRVANSLGLAKVAAAKMAREAGSMTN